MDAVHGWADVGGDFGGDEAVEGDEGFGFGAGGVEEGGAEDVHALDVDGGGGGRVVVGRGGGGGDGGGGGGGSVFCDGGREIVGRVGVGGGRGEG